MPLNEFEIIEKIFKSQDVEQPGVIAGIGDDAALLRIPDKQLLAVSTDTLVKGVHFPDDTAPFDIGYKSLAVNLSDMAAMAAEPHWATMSLTLPDSNREWLQELARGFFDIANRFKVSLIGGDISRGPLSITIQVLGCVPPGKQFMRENAMPGDDIYVSGILGMSAYALSYIKGSLNVDTGQSKEAFARFKRPVPRVDLAISLRGIVRSAIDISDGLAADLGHLITSSSVGADINLDQVPVYKELSRLDNRQKWEYALNTGDDYELCFTAPVKYHERILDIGKKSECGISCIGKITESKVITWNGADGTLVNSQKTGFKHF